MDRAQPGAIDSLVRNYELGDALGQFSDGWVVPASEPTASAQRSDLDETAFTAFDETSSATSLTVTIGPGEAFLNGWLATDTSTDVDLAASTAGQTVGVSWDPDAVFDPNTDADRDAADRVVVALESDVSALDPFLPLWTFDTDGSGVTSAVDERDIRPSADIASLNGADIRNADADQVLIAQGDGTLSMGAISAGEPVGLDSTEFDAYLQDQESANEMASAPATMGAVVASAPAMDAVSSSQTAMDAVSSSQTAMDAVSESTTAMDVVSESTTAMDVVSASTTAMDTVSASTTAMDVVSASQTAMDVVSASTTAMDTVSASQTARDAIGTSGVGYDAIAAVAMAIGKYAAGSAGLTPSNYADIGAVASDANAMDTVSASQTAMDVVSSSQTAMDAVSSSQTAMDAVSASQTAMDAVSASQTAMDVVSASQTAMDVVSASDLALQTLLLSDFVEESFWTQTVATEAVWGLGNPTPPTSVTVGNVDIDIGFNGTSEGGSSIHLQVSNFSGDFGETAANYTVVDEIDLTDVSTITFSTRASNSYESDSYQFDITLGSATLSVSSQHSWTSRSLDVSGISGLTAFEMDYEVREDATSQDWEIKNLALD